MKKYLWLIACLMIVSFPANAGNFCSYDADTTPALTDIVIVSDPDCEENNHKVAIGNLLDAETMPAYTVKGNNTGSTAAIDDLTTAEVRTLLGIRQLFCYPMSDQETALTTVDPTPPRRHFFPANVTVNGVYIYVNTAPTGGGITVDVKDGGVSLFSTKPTIDASEFNGGSSISQGTAATAAVFSDTAISANTGVTFEIDAVGPTIAGSGLVACLDVTF